MPVRSATASTACPSLRRRLLLVVLAATLPFAAACHLPTAVDDPGQGSAPSDNAKRDVRPWG